MFKKDTQELAEIAVFCCPNGDLLWLRQFYAPGKHFRARNMAAAPVVGAVKPTMQDFKSCPRFRKHNILALQMGPIYGQKP